MNKPHIAGQPISTSRRIRRFRATGITAYFKRDGTLEKAAAVASRWCCSTGGGMQ